MRRKRFFGDRTLGMPDRRTSFRFPLQLPVRYRAIGSSTPSEWIVSESVDISSGGLFFKTSEAVVPGQSLEAWVSWPVFLDNHIPLRLATKGLVVRNAPEGVAMRFETYEFRTGQVSAEARAAAAAAAAPAETSLSLGSSLKIAG